MLTKTGIHAIRATVVLSELEQGAYAGTGTIAQRIQAPKNYLGKMLQMLTREGILDSQKGLGGGFRLARSPNQISLYEIVDPIEKVSKRTGCLLGKAFCSDEQPCPLHNDWKCIRDQYINLLCNTTIADLTASEHQLIAITEE